MKQKIPLTPHFTELVNKVSITATHGRTEKLHKSHPTQSLLT